MTRTSAFPPRVIAFGDLEAGVWGAGWWSQEAFAAIGVVGAVPLTMTPAATLDGADAGEEWRLEGDGVQLVFAPAADAVRHPGADRELGGFDQLCRVRGTIVVDGAQRPVASLGRRSSRTAPYDPGRFESLRDVSGWYEPGEGVVISSLRPRRARGHGDDVITATLLEPGLAPPVSDPRLSTTYTAAGEPARMTLELWLDSDEEAGRYPRRAAGEAMGSRAVASLGGLEFHADLLRCHSRGLEGAGVYLLIRSE